MWIFNISFALSALLQLGSKRLKKSELVDLHTSLIPRKAIILLMLINFHLAFQNLHIRPFKVNKDLAGLDDFVFSPRSFKVNMAGLNDSAFSRVLSAFRSRLSRQDRADFELTTFKDLQNAIDEVQKAQAQRRGYRNLNKIRPFLNGLQQYSRVIEVFVNAKPDIMAFIWVRNCL